MMNLQSSKWVIVLMSMLVIASCEDNESATTSRSLDTADVGPQNHSNSDSDRGVVNPPEDEPPEGNPPQGERCESQTLAAPVLRRLTRLEFERNAEEALALPSNWARSSLPPDPVATHGLNNHVERQVTQRFVEELLRSSESIAAVVRTDPTLSLLLPCHPAEDLACAQTFLDTVGKRLYQRPLTEAETSRYLDLHEHVQSANLPFADFVEWATVVMLMSPHSVFRSEIGNLDGAGEQRRLDDFEIATALAYMITGRGADTALIELAEEGGLSEPEGIAAAAQRLAFEADGQTPTEAFREVLIEFIWQWLDLVGFEVIIKDDESFERVRQSMTTELRLFVEHVIFDLRGGVEALLTSDALFSNMELLEFYGFSGPIETRPANTGLGLLSQGFIMAMTSPPQVTHPTKRGIYVREKILCQDVPAPPPDIPELPEPEPTQTTRDRYEIHVESPACKGCHLFLDGVGFGFEGFDEVGRPRTHENGIPIDDSWLGVGDLEGEGPDNLARALAQQVDAYNCGSSMLMRFAFGVEDTTCFAPESVAEFRSGEMGFIDLYLSLIEINNFTHRVCVGEECGQEICTLECPPRGAFCENQVAVSDSADGVVTSDCICDFSSVEVRVPCGEGEMCQFGGCVEISPCDLSCPPRAAFCDEDAIVQDNSPGRLTTECTCDYSAVEERAICPEGTVCEDLTCVEAPCMLSCPPRGVFCEGRDIISDQGEGALTSECTCDYSAVEERTPCGEGQLCRDNVCEEITLDDEFVLVPAGTFTMGSLDSEPGRSADEPAHEVTLSRAFYMQSTEVTQGQFTALLGTNPSIFTDCGDRCPVERATWYNAITYANARSVVAGLDPCYNEVGEVIGGEDGDPYTCEGFRLPTEAEWEYAARAGTSTAIFNGDLEVIGCELDPVLSEVAWYCANAQGLTHQVAQKAANPFGLYDIHGNVQEWVFDTYRGDYQVLSAVDPFTIVVSHRVSRGGSWGTGGASTCRAASRHFADPRYVNNGLGLRLVRTHFD